MNKNIISHVLRIIIIFCGLYLIYLSTSLYVNNYFQKDNCEIVVVNEIKRVKKNNDPNEQMVYRIKIDYDDENYFIDSFYKNVSVNDKVSVCKINDNFYVKANIKINFILLFFGIFLFLLFLMIEINSFKKKKISFKYFINVSSLVLCLFGILFLTISIFTIIDVNKIMNYNKYTGGNVVYIDSFYNNNVLEKEIFIEYFVNDKEYEVRKITNSIKKKYTIYYNPNNPNAALISEDQKKIWTVLVSIIPFVIGLALKFFYSKLRKEK